MAKPMELPGRHLEVAAAACPPDNVGSPDAAKFPSEALVRGSKFWRNLGSPLVPTRADLGRLVVDRGFGDRELLAGEGEVVLRGGGALFEPLELLVKRFERLHDLELLVLEFLSLLDERRRLVAHRLLVAIRARPTRVQPLFDGRDAGSYCFGSLIKARQLGAELVALVPYLTRPSRQLGEPRCELCDRGPLCELAASICEAIEGEIVLLYL